MERANRTLQDRLVKGLRLGGISDMDAANAFLSGFVERYNERFSVRAAKMENLHRPLHVPPKKLSDILCHREQRYIGAQLTFHYDRKQIVLEQTELSRGFAGRYVELYKAQQDLNVRPKVMTKSEKGGYKKRTARTYGPDSDKETPRGGRGGDDGSRQKRRFHTFPPRDDDGSTMRYSLCSTSEALLWLNRRRRRQVETSFLCQVEISRLGWAWQR